MTDRYDLMCMLQEDTSAPLLAEIEYLRKQLADTEALELGTNERLSVAAEARYKELHNAARRCLRYDGIDPAKFNEAMRHMDVLIQRHIAEIKEREDGE